MPIIRLSDTNTQAFDEEYFIQQHAKEKFEELIRGFIKPAKTEEFITNKDCKPQSTCTETERVHNTILVDGKRGMGKTSFILSVLRFLEQDAELRHKKICNLCIIDPTMIEAKENIFLNIIARIKERVDEYRKSDRLLNERCYQTWEYALKKLAAGLSILDGVGSEQLNNELWDSPELILEKGLDNSKQGWKLESHFHDFLRVSLSLLEKDVFLLVLDDIDTSLKEGKAILETLRKYLTSKQLIIVMLGDIDLYATIVRQLQWEKMDPNGTLINYEKEDNEVKSIYRTQIEHLEEQYLTKLLKPENRIKLKTILELKAELGIHCDNDVSQPLTKVVRDLVEYTFLTKHQSRYAKLYEQTLLAQSTRSVVQVLKGGFECGIIRSNQNAPDQHNLNSFVDVLRQVFFTTLKKNLESFDLLYSTKEYNLLNRVAMYMLRKDISRDSHMKLLPEFRDDDMNITMFFLNAEINAQLKSQHYLSYLIKVGYALERFGAVGDPEHPERFIGHVGLDSNISNTHISRRMLGTFKVDSNIHQNRIFFGNFFLSKDDRKKISNGKNMALFMSRVFYPKCGHYTFLSLFNLLGVLADISVLAEISVDDERKMGCKKILEDCNLIRDFHGYNSNSVSGSEDYSFEADSEMTVFDVNIDHEKMSEWSKNASNITQLLSAADLANIWVRIAYNFNGIDSEPKNKSKTYKERFDLYIAALLNAIYICCEEKKGKNPDIKNPVTDLKYFWKKVDKYEQDSEYTLFDYLYSCPLWEEDFGPLLEDLKYIKQKTIIEYSRLSDADKINAIRSIPEWETLQISQIRKELQRNYTDVRPNIHSLVNNARNIL
jgi:hypothetical protein